jgi:hypothetical protein
VPDLENIDTLIVNSQFFYKNNSSLLYLYVVKPSKTGAWEKQDFVTQF